VVLNGRLNDEVREKKGATYSPSAQFMINETYPGLAAIHCTLDVKRHDAIKYSNKVRDLADKLSRKGVTDDELARAKAQYSAAMKGWLTDNNFWLNSVMADAQENPTSLTDVRSAASDINETTVSDLNQLAHKYLGADRVFRYTIDPTARVPKK
jgi:zinc protease